MNVADYDAPVAENGDLTEKYFIIQKVLHEMLPNPEGLLCHVQGLKHQEKCRGLSRICLWATIIRSGTVGNKRLVFSRSKMYTYSSVKCGEFSEPLPFMLPKGYSTPLWILPNPHCETSSFSFSLISSCIHLLRSSVSECVWTLLLRQCLLSLSK